MARERVKSLKDVEAELDAEVRKIVPNVPGNKKPLIVDRHPKGLYFVRFEGGGEVPAELQGYWTSKAKLEDLAQAYMDSRDCQAAA